MKAILEDQDTQEIAAKIADILRPMLACNGKCKHSGEDLIFDKKGLASYLRVSVSTINNLVMNRQIPFFKVQPGQSGAVRFRQRDIDKWIQRQSIPAINQLTT